MWVQRFAKKTNSCLTIRGAIGMDLITATGCQEATEANRQHNHHDTFRHLCHALFPLSCA